ncbi:hypothetical protein NN561_014816 [Cricetulus griseus]
MRYEKELQALSPQPAEVAAKLGLRDPKKGSVAKRRLVKLSTSSSTSARTRLSPSEPCCRVAQEEPRLLHQLRGRPQQEISLHRASYEYMRRSLPRLLQERDQENDRQGPLGAVWHL